jgi:hypothetical protein
MHAIPEDACDRDAARSHRCGESRGFGSHHRFVERDDNHSAPVVVVE